MKREGSTKFWIVLSVVSLFFILCGVSVITLFKSLRPKIAGLEFLYDLADEHLFPQQNALENMVSSYFEDTPTSPETADLDDQFWLSEIVKMDEQISSLQKLINEKKQKLGELREEVSTAHQDAEMVESMSRGALFKEWLQPLYFILDFRKEILVTARLAEELADITERTKGLKFLLKNEFELLRKPEEESRTLGVKYHSPEFILGQLVTKRCSLKLNPPEKGTKKIKKFFDFIVLQEEKSRQVRIMDRILSPKRLVDDLNEFLSVISFFNENYTNQTSKERQEMLEEIQESQNLKNMPNTKEFIEATSCRLKYVIEDLKSLPELVYKTNQSGPITTLKKSEINTSILGALNAALVPSKVTESTEEVENLKKKILAKNNGVEDLDDFDLSPFSSLSNSTIESKFILEITAAAVANA